MSELTYTTPNRHAKIFSGNANPELAAEVAGHLDTELSPRTLEAFSDGEINCQLEDSVRGNYIFVIQPHGGGGMDPNVALMEQLLLCGAAKGASAKKVIAVCPYFGYGRQDRKSKGREPISAQMACAFLDSAGVDGIVSIDLHSSQIQGFFGGKPFDNLTAAPVLRNSILPQLEEGVILVSPDAGRIKTAAGHRKRMPAELNAGTAYIDKVRPKGTVNVAEALEVAGNDVEGHQCLLIDDMIDTGGSLAKAADLLIQRGAKEVLAIATHPILSDKAINNLGGSAIKQLEAANTRALTPEQKSLDILQVNSVAKLISEAIDKIFRDGSISDIFDESEHRS
jgi:ribose-phosphate pyrophosphokinase